MCSFTLTELGSFKSVILLPTHSADTSQCQSLQLREHKTPFLAKYTLSFALKK